MNAAIHKKGNDTISYFIRDCTKSGNNFKGSNGSVAVNLNLFSVVWTNDVATEISEGNWDKTIDQLNHESTGVELGGITYQELEESIGKRELINNLTFAELETYIENNVTDFATAKDFIKTLSQVTLALCKLVCVK